MILSIFAGLLLSSGFGYAAPIKVETKVFVDDILVSSPTVFVEEGDSASLDVNESSEDGQKYLKLNLLVQSLPEADKSVELKFNLDQSSGRKTVKAKSRLVLRTGEPAVLGIGSMNDKNEIRITALATRQ